MGLIRVPITLEGKKLKAKVTALVDTGASLTVIPQALADRLKLVPFKTVTVSLADGRERRMPIGQAMVRIDDRSAPANVLVSPHGEVLLGAETLELLDISVDSKHRRLKFGKHFALKAA